MQFPVVVPAAGEGTRLRPLTAERPKGLVEVDGDPLLTHCFEVLPRDVVSRFVVVTGYMGDAIRQYYGDEYDGIPIVYTEQAEPIGLADAVLTAEPHVDGPFLVCNGDNVIRGNLDELIRTHARTDAAATLLVEDVSIETARTRGVCVLDDEGDLTGYVEKPADPPSTRASAGVFAFDEVVFDACRVITPSDRGEYELTDAIDLLLYAGHRVGQLLLDGERVNVNSVEDIEAAVDVLR
ncbi:sugar phosphate nucleotidyltransferase [Salinigranum sp. GCM10025319]|uniref:sugar phosphate nucleotidyltransferase n=1 Tax=Salinigranum sp. GCM10025319 TaxID=3252687 RepID=UPI00361623D4